MSSGFVVQYATTPDTADENQQLIERVFGELRAQCPDGLRYASFRLDDGTGFLHVGVIDGDDNPLAGSPAFREFQRDIGERVTTAPNFAVGSLIGSYGFDQVDRGDDAAPR